MVCDPISDMFTRIRNALMVKHAEVLIPHSKLKESLCKILVQEGFVQSYSMVGDVPHKRSLAVVLKYRDDKSPAIRALKRISKSSKRVYVACTQIPKLNSGFGLVFLSTSKGVLSGKAARLAKVGGELIGSVH